MGELRLEARERQSAAIRGLVIATLAVALATFVDAAPAHAATCTVNGVSQTGQYINGTAGDDIITCGAISETQNVKGLDGNDTITTGDVTGGGVNGGGGNDTITTGPIAPGMLLGGKLFGDTGDDILRTPSVRSILIPPYYSQRSSIYAGPGNDTIDGTTLGTPVVVEGGSIVSGGTGIDSCNVSHIANPALECE